jgi:gliding motility-associated-like protein
MYYTHVTNPGAPDLTLKSRIITLNVNAIPCAALIGVSLFPPSLSYCQGSTALLEPGAWSSYSWSTGVSAPTISVSTPGSYRLTITDNTGCTLADTVSVLEMPRPNVQVMTTPNGCLGNSGAIDLTTSSGTAPYTYDWADLTGPNEPQDRIQLPNATYQVTISDANGCTRSPAAIPISTTTNLPTASATTTPAACGQSTGTVTLNVTGGAAPYTYHWSNLAVSGNLVSVAAGTYTVTVTDTNGCTTSTSAVVGNTNGPIGAIAGTTPSACNPPSGTVDLNVSGGTTPYTYLWSNMAVTQDLNATAQGTYTVTVTDANGCTTTGSATIASTPAPVATILSTTPAGCSTGSIDLNATGGMSPYAYLWNTGAVTQDLSGMVASTYTVTITDTKGCTATASATVLFLDSPDVTAAATPASCGLSNGTVTLSVTNGASPYHYNWADVGGADNPPNRSGLNFGIYIVTVTDANGCSASTSIIVPLLIAPVLSVSNSSAVCGTNSGSIDLNVSNGTAPFLYNWADLPGSNDPEDRTGLGAGLYVVTVTDGVGCTATGSATIVENTPPVAQLLVTENSDIPGDLTVCAGDGATFTAGGGNQYQFWVNDIPQTTGFTTISTLSLNALQINTTVKVVTANGACKDTTLVGDGIAQEPITLTIIALPNLGMFALSVVPACPGEPVGIKIVAPNLANGVYTVQYKVNNAAVQTAAVTFSNGVGILSIGQFSPQTGAAFQILQIGNNGAGCAGVPGTGGTLSFDVLSSIQTMLDTTICNTQSITIDGQTFNQTGTYTIPQITPEGCEATLTLKLQVVSQFTRQETATFCAGASYVFYGNTLTQQGNYEHLSAGPAGCDTLVQLTLFKQPPVYHFLNDTICAGISYPVGDSLFTSSGFYQVTLESSLGCDSIVSLTLLVKDLSLSFPQNMVALCSGEGLTLTPAVQGCQNCQYEWSTGASQAVLNVVPVENTVYSLTITSGNDCTAVGAVAVTLHPAYMHDFEKSICPGETVQAGGSTLTEPGTYFLDLQSVFGCDSMVALTLNLFDTTRLSALRDTLLFPPDDQTTRTISVTDNDVHETDYQLKLVQEHPPHYGRVDILNNNELRYTFDNPEFSGVDSFQYALCPADCPDNCSTAWVIVRIQGGNIEAAKKFIPNVITPNDDGSHDIFDPVKVLLDQGIEIQESQLFIINRWGETIFEQKRGKGEPNAWDGKQGKNPLPQGTYYYQLRVVSSDEYRWSGPVNLLR